VTTILPNTKKVRIPPKYDTWLPKYGDTVKIVAEWLGGGAPPQINFKLDETSTYAGRALNDPDPTKMKTHNYPDWYYDSGQNVDNYNGPDFGLTETAPNPNSLDPSNSIHSFAQGPITVSGVVSESTTYTIYLQCWDYGGRTKVVAEGGEKQAELWVPKIPGADKRMASAWDYDGDPLTTNPVPVQDLSEEDDIDAIIFTPANTKETNPPGDDFNNFEEYRGILFVENNVLKHKRLNPYRKDLFIRAKGYDWEYPFTIGDAFKNAGIDVHNTTDWKHDATEKLDSAEPYGEFFIYYRMGDVTKIDGDEVWGPDAGWLTSWPSNEFEFKLDSDSEEAWTPISFFLAANPAINKPLRLILDTDYDDYGNNPDGSPVNYLIRIPLPHINVLIVRHDRKTTKVKISDDPQGLIKYEGSDAPGPGNPMGSRDWGWSTKGYSRWNRTDKQYGIAISLAKPLDHYFDNKPYFKGTVWDETLTQWRPAESDDMVLAPLSLTEDPEDSGYFLQDATTLEYYYDGYVPRDTANDAWDGDRRLLDKNEWTGEMNLSPFDIDNNGYIELPPAIDPYSDNSSNQYATYDDDDEKWKNPYTKVWVLMHTITHEIGHALGGYKHSPFPDCLMHDYSYDWKRQDFMSDWYRARLMVHNKIREIPKEVFDE